MLRILEILRLRPFVKTQRIHEYVHNGMLISLTSQDHRYHHEWMVGVAPLLKHIGLVVGVVVSEPEDHGFKLDQHTP